MAPRKKAKTNSDPLGKVPDGRCRISRPSELFQMSERGVRLLAQKGIIPKPCDGLLFFDASVMGYVGYLRQFSRGRRPDDPTSVDDGVRLLRAKADTGTVYIHIS